MDLDFRRARLFFGLFTLLIALGAGLALIPSQSIVPILVSIQVANGVLVPILIVFLLLLINDRRLDGNLANGRWANS